MNCFKKKLGSLKKQRGQKADGKGSRKKLSRVKSNQGKSTVSLRSFDLNRTEKKNILYFPSLLPPLLHDGKVRRKGI